MPPITEPNLKAGTSPFIGLQSYTEAQSGMFFGRDAEIEGLTKLIRSNTLTIVFGKSGTGKTSLLNAGVFPLLRKEYCLPFRIRLEFGEDSPQLIAQVKNVLRTEIQKYGFSVESFPGNETLWEYFHREPLWKTVTPILIFDQFEEIFTLARKTKRFSGDEMNNFWEELSDLIENSIPEKLKEKFLNRKEEVDYSYKQQKIKILFAFREEYLPEFESITTKIPSIKYSRFRLLPMNGHQAYEVITKNWKENIMPAEAHAIVAFFDTEKDMDQYELMEIEPSLLSQVCSYIDRERIEEGYEQVSSEFLKKYPKELILRQIYDEALTASNAAITGSQLMLQSTPSNLMKEFLEDKLITDEGFRTKYNLTDKDEEIRPGIEILKSKYFLREDGKSIELTHDVLAPVIKADREKRRRDLALAKERKKARKKALIGLAFTFLLAAATYFFVTFSANKEKQKARHETQVLRDQIKKDSARLLTIADSIEKVYNNLNTIIKNLPQNVVTEKKIDSLSNELGSLSQRYMALKVEHEKDQEEYASRPKIMRLPKPAIDTRFDSLYPLYSALLGRYDLLNSEYKKLQKEFDDYKRANLQTTVIPKTVKAMEPLDSVNSLRLNLYYNFSKNDQKTVPENLLIYLIPYTNSNRAIIRSAKVYEIYCNESNLNKAENKKIARYSNGYYIFPDVSPGKYLIKICTYYGGYYTYEKKEPGTEMIRWDASPPIRE